ncbi:hypothetical protein [Nonomuraea sp. NPDC050786]|uniref:hypothetical protein n=1 Tax=Nonomuraea sp. NPDC050786 TaxID=3154840 RepID=UPI0033C4CC3D
MNAGSGKPVPPESADIELTATVQADELRFGEVPRTRVDFTGGPDRKSGSGSDRTNLPDRVEKNVTYRRVQVDYALVSTLSLPADE